MARLVVMYGAKHEQTVGLDVPKLLIGRGDDVGLQVQNQTISRHHCQIETEGTRHLLVDLDSTSGTFLNGNKLDRPITLQHGDKIELGKHTVVYERDAIETGVTAATAAASPDAANTSSPDFWTDGLKESGFQAGRSTGKSASMPDGDAPWEASASQPASALAGDDIQAGVEQYAGTMLASEGQMKRIRETLLKQQGVHLSVVVKGERVIVPMKDDCLEVGYFDGADFRLPGSRLFGKRQFRIEPSGTAWMVKVGSMWARIEMKGERIRKAELLTGGEVIEAAGLKFKFSKGD